MPDMIRLRIGSLIPITHPADVARLGEVLAHRGYQADPPDLIRAWSEWSRDVLDVDWHPVSRETDEAILDRLMGRLVPIGGEPGQARPQLTPLTTRQAEILSSIEGSLRTRKIPPTIRELMAAHGIHSPNGVVAHLKAIRAKGYIRWEPQRSRSLQLTY